MIKNIALVAPVFPPIKISASVQLNDLAIEFCRQGFKITVFVPSDEICNPYKIVNDGDMEIISLKVPKSRDKPYIIRTIAELLMPFFMLRNYKKIKSHPRYFSGIVWYSPPIFLSPFIKFLMKENSCLNYLIVRDIFPEWALNLGLLKKGMIYNFFKYFEKQQYKIANVIGVQAQGNLKFFDKKTNHKQNSIEVLNNWLYAAKSKKCTIDFSAPGLKDKKIIIYAGNMGVAQDLDFFIELAAKMQSKKDICFLFVGRGSNKENMIKKTNSLKIKNLQFFDEIDPQELNSLLKKCHIGILSLDRRHRTHNIPGKFLTYLSVGLPVFALINSNNDLHSIIKKYDVGYSLSDYSIKSMEKILTKQLLELEIKSYSKNCKQLYEEMFLPEKAVKQIIKALKIE